MTWHAPHKKQKKKKNRRDKNIRIKLTKLFDLIKRCRKCDCCPAKTKTDVSFDILNVDRSVLDRPKKGDKLFKETTDFLTTVYSDHNDKASTYKAFKDGEKITSTARYNKHYDFYYDAYNTALFIDTSGVVGSYHKIKLVAGVEQMPYQNIIKPIEKLAINLGGISGSLGKDTIPFVY